MNLEAQKKIESVRKQLAPGQALRMRSVDWFAWITSGIDSSVIFSQDEGVAEVLITHEASYMLTSPIEESRFAADPRSNAFSFKVFPWIDTVDRDKFVASTAKIILSDRPRANEKSLPFSLTLLKHCLIEEEIARYYALGRDAAMAASSVLKNANSKLTEQELAGFAAKALWEKGIHPMLTLVAGQERVDRFRHPVAGPTPLGKKAMLVICGRRDGLYANFTRQVFWRKPTELENTQLQMLASLEAAAFSATCELKSLAQIFAALKEEYSRLACGDEIEKHHQGGSCGYLSREIFATPTTDAQYTARPSMAFAWNPSFAGAKLEDTVLLDQSKKIQVLTHDPEWPSFIHNGLNRPNYLILG